MRCDQVDRFPLDDLVAEHVHQATFLEVRPHATGRLARLCGDGTNLLVVVGRGVGDRLVLGDPLQDEVLLERRGRASHDRLPQFVDMPTDGIVVKTAPPQFENRPLQFPQALATEQIRGQVPTGRRRQRARHLLPHLTPTVPLKLVLQLLEHGRPQVIRRLERAELIEQFRGQIREFEVLDIHDRQLERDILAAERLDGRLVRHLDGGGDGSTGAGLGDELVEARQFGVCEGELGPHNQFQFRGVRQHRVAVEAPQIRHDQVARLGRTFMGHEPRPLAQQVGERLVHVGIGDRAGGASDRQSLPFGQVKFRSHLDLELERHRPICWHEDGVHVELGLADGRELFLLGHLRHRVRQQLAADLVGKLRLEAAAHESPRRTAGPESWQHGGGHHLAECIVAVAVDVFPRDRHPHAALAGRDFVDGDIELEGLGGRFVATRCGGCQSGCGLITGRRHDCFRRERESFKMGRTKAADRRFEMQATQTRCASRPRGTAAKTLSAASARSSARWSAAGPVARNDRVSKIETKSG